MKFLLSAAVVLLSVVSVYANAKQPITTVVGGYYPSWPSPCNRLPVDKFDPSPFTHLWYAFATINTTTWLLDVGDDYKQGGVLYGLVKKKKQGWNGKLSVSVGGAVSIDFWTPLTSNPDNIQKFSSQVVSWLRKYNFDGIDLDWEFPIGQDAVNYNSLFAAIQAAFVAEKRPRGVDKLLLTTASWGDAVDAQLWPIADMAKNLDWFNIMFYEEHGPWDTTTPTGINAPIRSDDPYNGYDTVNGYIAQGAPANKLVLGAPTFAHSWILADKTQHGVGAPGAGAWPALYCTESEGYMAYFEVKDIIKHDKSVKVVWDKQSQTPYLYNDTLWVSYDDPASFLAKASFAIENRLKGFMLWSITWDDKNEMITPASNLIKNLSNTSAWQSWLNSIFGKIFGRG